MASDLFVALAMDTGWFRHSNTTPATFALASELVAAGARPELLYDELFEHNSPARLRLVGLVLERLTVAPGGKVAFTELRRGDYEATGATPQDSEDLVNYTRSVQGVEVGPVLHGAAPGRREGQLPLARRRGRGPPRRDVRRRRPPPGFRGHPAERLAGRGPRRVLRAVADGLKPAS